MSRLNVEESLNSLYNQCNLKRKRTKSHVIGDVFFEFLLKKEEERVEKGGRMVTGNPKQNKNLDNKNK